MTFYINYISIKKEKAPIFELQYLHLPPNNIQDNIGILSNFLISFLQCGQYELGFTSDIPLGNLNATTPAKLAKDAPNTNANIENITLNISIYICLHLYKNEQFT